MCPFKACTFEGSTNVIYPHHRARSINCTFESRSSKRVPKKQQVEANTKARISGDFEPNKRRGHHSREPSSRGTRSASPPTQLCAGYSFQGNFLSDLRERRLPASMTSRHHPYMLTSQLSFPRVIHCGTLFLCADGESCHL